MPNEVGQFMIMLVVAVVLAICLGALAARLFVFASRGSNDRQR